MKVLEQKNISYSGIIRYEFTLQNCSIRKAKKLLKQKLKELNACALCCNIYNNGSLSNVIDYAPNGKWGDAHINRNHQFYVYPKKKH